MSDQIDIGLALSGGGYRAMLFNLGALWRLNELGWLRKIDMITSVSGGSILNGVLATRWTQLQWNDGVATNFEQIVAEPIRTMASTAIDVMAGIEGLLSVFSSVADKIIDKYDETLFLQARLHDTPAFEKGKTPRFLFYATSLQTGSSVRMERKRLADYKIGEIREPDLSVAQVVAASSAFPPILSPVRFKLDPAKWVKFDGDSPGLPDLSDDFRRNLLLTDGGVYDNMGLEAISNRCKTVLVSDAGAPLQSDADPPTEWGRQATRVLDIVIDQTRALRRRALINAFERGGTAAETDLPVPEVGGAYWGIRTRIGDYGLSEVLARDNEVTHELQFMRTRLNTFTDVEQGRLINWGYALADAGIRKHLLKADVAPGVLPAVNGTLA